MEFLEKKVKSRTDPKQTAYPCTESFCTPSQFVLSTRLSLVRAHLPMQKNQKFAPPNELCVVAGM
jgi:hypothetical protein